jgi:hypothetical protein
MCVVLDFLVFIFCIGGNVDYKKLIRDLLQNKMINTKELFEIGLEYLDEYELSLKNKRDSLIYNSCNCNISFILNSPDFCNMRSAQKITFLVDMLFYLKPTLQTPTSCSVNEVIEQFKVWCKKEDILNSKEWHSWLYEMKDPSVRNWLIELLK